MMKRASGWLMIAALSGMTLGASRDATAGLMGSTVNVSAYYPTTTNVLANPGDAVVNAGIEYAAGSFANYNPTWQVDVTDDQFILSNANGYGVPFLAAGFNGFILKVLSGPTILSASVAGSSEFSPVSVTLLNGNEVQINYSGVSFTNPQEVHSSVIALTFAPSAVPEPSSLISGGIACLSALALVRRRGTRTGS